MGGPAVRLVKNVAVVESTEQAVRLTKAGIASVSAHSDTRYRAGSGREALTTLGTATIQDMATALCGHAGTEAVGTLALENAGLESSFHDKVSKLQGLAAPSAR